MEMRLIVEPYVILDAGGCRSAIPRPSSYAKKSVLFVRYSLPGHVL